MKAITGKKTVLLNAWLTIALLLLLLPSCHTSHPEKTDHPAFFDSVIASAPNIPETLKQLQYIDSVYSTRPDAGIGDLCQKYFYKARYYRARDSYQQAITYTDSILSITNEKKYDLQHAEANLLKGDIYFDQGLYNYAYQYFYLEKRMADDAADSCNYNTYLADFNTRMAVISYNQGVFTDAVSYYKQSLDNMWHNCKTGAAHYYEIQGALSNLALSYERSGRPDSTLYYYNMCLGFLSSGASAFLDKDFMAMAKGSIYGNMGDAYMAKGAFAIADSLYQESIRINSQKGYYNQDALMTTVKLARLYLKMGRLAETGIILTNMGCSKQLSDNNSRISFLQTRAAYYKATGKYKEAIEDLQHYIRLNDSAQLYKEKFVRANINNVFQVLKQGNDIHTLKKQDQVKNILLATVIVFLLMGLLVLVLTMRNGRQVKKHSDEVKKRNKEQQFALVALELRNRDNARMSNVLAHDLKNPIHAISSIASILLNDAGRPADDVEMLELIIGSGANLSNMIDDVLIYRNKSGATIVNKEQTDLTELLKNSVSLLQFKATDKKQTILFEGNNPFFVLADKDQLWRVINNLLVNAIKFSPHNTTITAALKKTDKMVQLSVADEGIGIPEGFGNKIFDLFTETKRTGTDDEETFGLGLYISRHIVEAHGGKIWFENAPVKGTVFYVTLPLEA